MRRSIATAMLALVLAGGTAEGSLVVGFVSQANNGNGTTTYNYTVTLDAGTTLGTGDYLVFYDVLGLQSGTPTAGYVFPNLFLGPYPVGTTPPLDNPGLLNIGFSRSGAPIVGPTSFALTLTSTDAAPIIGHYGAQTNSGTAGVVAPLLGPFGVSGVPEPSSLALAGVLGVGAALNRWGSRRWRPSDRVSARR